MSVVEVEREDIPEEEKIQQLQAADSRDIRKLIEMHMQSVWLSGNLSQNSVAELKVRVIKREGTQNRDADCGLSFQGI